MVDRSTIETLERLIDLVKRYDPIKYTSTDEMKELYEAICVTYGQVSDKYSEATGKKNIAVPPDGRRGGVTMYPNYFEAGYLSGFTDHAHAGKSELLTVIGKMKAKLDALLQETNINVKDRNSVFLVHGHNETVLQTCARFIEKLGLSVTILREQPNKGRTIIKKFMDHSDVGFAVVLLTADDRGGTIHASFEAQSLRARQNVIFELGFFIGILGPDRVCALYEDGVEIPSDYQGVAFVPLDAKQAWRFELAKEMKAAGLSVDLNKAF